jgi:hypothetical protein
MKGMRMIGAIACGISLCMALLAGCAKEKPAEPQKEATGRLVLMLTDRPIAGMEVVKFSVTISGITVHKAGAGETAPKAEGVEATEADQAEEKGEDWINIPLDKDSSVKEKVFDLIELRTDSSESIKELLGETMLKPGRYTQIRLSVVKASITVNEGGTEKTLDLEILGKNRLKIVREFQVLENGETEIVLDFDAERSVIRTGKDEYKLRPTIKLSSVKEKGP